MLKPYDYQQKIIDRFDDETNAALFLDAGCGKTLIVANLLRNKYNRHRRVLKTVILAPIIVLDNWKRELLACTKLTADKIAVVTGTKAKRLKLIRDAKTPIKIINYEALRSHEILDALMEFQAEAVVCDESHSIKTPKLKTPMGKPTGTKAVFLISEKAWYRYIMSGTPITRDAQDLWSQFYFLDRGKTFGDRFWHFKKKYFVDLNAGMPAKNYFPNWRFIPSLEDEVNQKINAKAARLKLKDCVDLPELVEQTIEVEPTREQLKHYNELKNELITWLDDQAENPLVVQNALTKILRLNEILAGYLKLEDETIEPLKENPRLDRLSELIDSIMPNKVIIFSVFRETYKHIATMLEKKKIKYVEINGNVSTNDKFKNVDLFNDVDSEFKVAIVNPQSGGVGINLKAAKYSIFYTRNFSMKDYEQAVARNYRSGSIDFHETVVRYNMVSKNTIDEAIFNAIFKKKQIANSLLELKKLLT